MEINSVHLEDKVLIDSPIEYVFAYLTDFRNVPNWHKNMLKSDWKTNPPHGVGSEYDWIETFAGKKLNLGGTITTWNPPHSFTWEPTINPYSMTGGWLLKEKGASTEVTRYSDSKLIGFFKWFSFLLVPMAERQVHRELQVLKRLVEEACANA